MTSRSLDAARKALPLVLAALLGCGEPGPAGPPRRCEAGELIPLGTALGAWLDCELERPPDGRSCPKPRLDCGRAMPAALAELLSPADPDAGDSRPGLGCRRAALHASANYLKARLAQRAQGERRATGAAAFSGEVASRCGASAAGDAGTGFGGACTAAPTPGRLADCIRASLERIVDDVSPRHLAPSVVLILTDDQRPETVAFMPELEQIAAEGVRFPEAFVTSPLCTPSRASLYSGLHVYHHGSTTNQQRFDDSDSLAPWLARAGYATGFFGKYRNDTVRGAHVPPGWSEWQAFNAPDDGSASCLDTGDCYVDYVLSENGELVSHGSEPEDYSTDLLAERLLAFISLHADAPFFAVYAPIAAHKPALPSERHRGLFADLPPHRPPNWNAGAVAEKPRWVGFARAGFDAAAAARTDARRIREIESLQSVDEAVGRIRERLESLGLRDNTLFLYTSDQGIHWGEHGWVAKFSPYEASIRVPLVLSYPALAPAAAVRDELVLNIDLAPTIAAATGARSGPVDGTSLLPLLTPGGGEAWRSDFLIENHIDFLAVPSTAVRTRRWKYIESDVRAGVDVELYDLEADPHELENLASSREHRTARALLARRLRALRGDETGPGTAHE